jgi:transporter family protein
MSQKSFKGLEYEVPMPRWLGFCLATLALWSAWGVAAKRASALMPSAQCQAFGFLGVLPVLAFLFLMGRRRHPQGCSAVGWAWSISGGLLSCAGNVCCFQALRLGGKASAVVPLTALYPAATAALAMLVLREPLRPATAVGMVLAVAAVGASSGGWGVNLEPWTLYATAPIVLWGTAALLQKIATEHASADWAALGYLAAFAPTSLFLLILEPPLGAPALHSIFEASMVGLFSSLGTTTLIAAFAAGGRASVVTPLCALYPAGVAAASSAALGETIAPSEWAALAAATAAGLCLAWTPRQANQPKAWSSIAG